ncbi:hypothetical protein ACS0TY_010815 [Phlomoides rotata]
MRRRHSRLSTEPLHSNHRCIFPEPECPPLFSRSSPTFLEPASPPPLSQPSDRDRRTPIFQFLELMMKPGNTVVLRNAKIDMFKAGVVG